VSNFIVEVNFDRFDTRLTFEGGPHTANTIHTSGHAREVESHRFDGGLDGRIGGSCGRALRSGGVAADRGAIQAQSSDEGGEVLHRNSFVLQPWGLSEILDFLEFSP
jgi:hypothetical protein